MNFPGRKSFLLSRENFFSSLFGVLFACNVIQVRWTVVVLFTEIFPPRLFRNWLTALRAEIGICKDAKAQIRPKIKFHRSEGIRCAHIEDVIEEVRVCLKLLRCSVGRGRVRARSGFGFQLRLRRFDFSLAWAVNQLDSLVDSNLLTWEGNLFAFEIKTEIDFPCFEVVNVLLVQTNCSESVIDNR